MTGGRCSRSPRTTERDASRGALRRSRQPAGARRGAFGGTGRRGDCHRRRRHGRPLARRDARAAAGAWRRVRWIRGNADRELDPNEQGLAPPDVIAWVRDQLSEEQVAFLHGLPERLELDVDGVGRVLFCHATPQNDTDIFLEGLRSNAWRPRSSAWRPMSSCAATRTCSSLVRSPGSGSSTRAASAWRTTTSRVPTGCALGPDVEHRRTAYDPAGLDGSAFPGDYFRGGRPSKAEVTELFGANAVGA